MRFTVFLYYLCVLVYVTAVQRTLANCVYVAHLPHLKVRLSQIGHHHQLTSENLSLIYYATNGSVFSLLIALS